MLSLYTFKIDNRDIITTITEPVYQYDDLSNVHILIPKEYEGINVHRTNVVLEYVLPISKEKYSVILQIKNADYKNRWLEYIVLPDENITSQPGDLTFRLWINDKKIEYGKIHIIPSMLGVDNDEAMNDMSLTRSLAAPLTISPQLFNSQGTSQYSDYDPDMLLDDGRYPVHLEYFDFDYSIVDDKRVIELSLDQMNIGQESNSQYIPFRMNRYWDGIDILDKKVEIFYVNPAGDSDSVTPINFRYNSSLVTFAWLISNKVTKVPGTIVFEIQVHGSTINGKEYVFKTKQCEDMIILQSLRATASQIVEPEPDWFSNVSRLMNDKTLEINTSVENNNILIDEMKIAKQEAVGATESAVEAAKSIDVAVQSAQEAKESYEKVSEIETDVRNFVDKEKSSFVGYSKRESDIQYSNALLNYISGTGEIIITDAWNVPVKNFKIYGDSKQNFSDITPPNIDDPQEVKCVKHPTVVNSIGNTNLLKHSYDFAVGDRLQGCWKVDTSKPWNRFVDDDGAAVLESMNRTDLVSDSLTSIHSPLIPIQQVIDHDLYVSVYIKVADVDVWDTQTPLVYELFDVTGTRVAWRDVPIANLDLSNSGLISGEWTRATYLRKKETVLNNLTYVSGKTQDDVLYLSIRFSLFRNGQISFKKPKLELDNLTPWIPNPADIDDSNYQEHSPYIQKAVLPIELYGIDNMCDVLMCRDGTWGIERNVDLINSEWESLSDDIQKKLNDLTLYSEKSHVSVLSESDIVPEFSIEYVQDGKKVINQLRFDLQSLQNQINELKEKM